MAACRNVYDGCIKYLLRNLSVIGFGQFDSEILYKDTEPKYKIAHITTKLHIKPMPKFNKFSQVKMDLWN